MSNNFTDTDESDGEQKFYGKPQHEHASVDDRDIFAAASDESEEEEDDERALYCHMPHYRVNDKKLARRGGSHSQAFVA